ncbi:hypothetical protein BAUCODRAFT_351065 [Baudoinia panamericana UAMH 10762]|uniref:Uncharacterized protein n=1 Tax=Baudoinia panamericana (strain UAMH 10762) TaxID=717646 RepID=M2NKX5_BAUPA|nr:uncharacterized protein BAUCODRAFT_351065 [Baudoinia panamericana UAMH 10762]EMC99795.1 hypothetical protein BAUCODRAFT_351065 [Baudoinia panamericana UAMH 10762]
MLVIGRTRPPHAQHSRNRSVTLQASAKVGMVIAAVRCSARQTVRVCGDMRIVLLPQPAALSLRKLPQQRRERAGSVITRRMAVVRVHGGPREMLLINLQLHSVKHLLSFSLPSRNHLLD